MERDEGDDQAYERQIRRAARLKQVVLALFVLGIAGGFAWLVWPAEDPYAGQPVELSKAERGMVERTLADWGGTIGPDGTMVPYQIPVEIRDAIVAVDPRSATGTCPVELPRSRADGSPAGLTPYVLHTLASDGLANASTAPVVPGVERYEVFFVAEQRVPAMAVGERLRPGRVEGRAYLWSHAARQIVCAGRVAATSSDQVTYRSSIAGDHMDARAALDRDLALALARAIPDALLDVDEAPRAGRRASVP